MEIRDFYLNSVLNLLQLIQISEPGSRADILYWVGVEGSIFRRSFSFIKIFKIRCHIMVLCIENFLTTPKTPSWGNVKSSNIATKK